MSEKSQPRPPQVTLADVASHVGVSSMTVSKVLRGRGSISAKTRQKIQEAVRELGYVPNKLAGSLSSRTSNLIGVVLPSLSDVIFGEMVSAINEVLRPRGFAAFVGESLYDPKVEVEAIGTILSLQPAGFIIYGGLDRLEQSRNLLRNWGCPIVEIWDIEGQDADCCIGPSHAQAGRKIAEHFIDRGYARPAYVGAELNKDVLAARRLAGFLDIMDDAGIDVVQIHDNALPRQAASGSTLTRKLMAKHPECDAIYYLNDAMAMGGLSWLHAKGFEIPEEIAAAGFNGTSLSQSVRTRLTTVAVDRFGLGQMASKSLLSLLDGEAVEPVIAVPADLVLGNTT